MRNVRKSPLILLSLAFVLLTVGSANGQTCPPPACQANSGPVNSHWPANTTVSVYISNNFTATQQAAIAQTFNNWSAAAAASGITYNIQYGIPASLPPNYHTVERAAPVTMVGAAGETSSPNSLYGLPYDYAVTRIDPHVTDLQALRSVMAHEIGHTMGLADCPTCCPGTTVMRGGRPDPVDPSHADYNYSGGMRDTPSECDKETSRQRIEADKPEPEEEDTPGGSSGELAPSTTEQTCWVRVYKTCNADGSNCVVTGYQYLGCW